MRVHQITASLVAGDAVSGYVLEIDRYLREWGVDARVYAENIDELMAPYGKCDLEYHPFLDETGDVLIYHHSIYAANLNLYRRSRNRKLVIYHNITPHEFFHNYNKQTETICRFGRMVLSDFRDCELALSDSEFNRSELVAAGVPEAHTGVLPISLGLDRFANARRNDELYAQIKKNAVNLLYVGRMVPNKACEDLIKILYIYRKYINPDAHLWLVGSLIWQRYIRFLEALIERFELQDAVTFTGPVYSPDDLRTYYEASDVFLYASRHEGFGLPLAESMLFDLPILAYKSSAVPETLGGSGVLYTRFEYAAVAEMLHLLATDRDLRRQIVARQRQRLQDFDPGMVTEKLRQVFEGLGIL